MRAGSCTIDSSCIIALDHLNLLPQLTLLFSIVLVPKAVRRELFKRRSTKDRVRSLFESYAFLRRCDDYESGAVDFLLAERSREGGQDRGEVESVVQAAQFGAAVIVDDPWGRELASRYDLEFHGTLWVLQRFHELDLLSGATLRDCFVSLRRRRTRLPWDAVNALLLEIKQEPLENHPGGVD
jgi:predicted nucleic acid-binding protein